jgi:CheY-like chemotaxis protein
MFPFSETGRLDAMHHLQELSGSDVAARSNPDVASFVAQPRGQRRTPSSTTNLARRLRILLQMPRQCCVDISRAVPAVQTAPGGRDSKCIKRFIMAHILLVDDDSENLWSLHMALEGDGHRVISVEDAVQALRLLQQESVEFMITDYEMPHIDGAELCRLARSQPACYRLPIVLLSAAPEPSSPRYWTRYLRKPTRLDELAAIIDAYAAVRLPCEAVSVRPASRLAPCGACRWPALDARCWP